MEVKAKGAKGVITTSPKLLQLLRRWSSEKSEASLDNYAGSIIETKGVEYLILNPLQQLFTVSYGKFLAERYLSKFTHPHNWFQQTEFRWEVANESTIDAWYLWLSKCDYIAIDIETGEENRRINCVSYTGVTHSNIGFSTRTVVLPCISSYWLEWIRKLNYLSVPKIFQNGKYDNAYFFRFGAPVKGWYFDTINLFHSWYSELPKRLDFLATFALRKVEFWKDEGSTGNLEDYYRYNARDGWATANSFLSLIGEMPEWAVRNYLQEFPTIFPCHQAEMTGMQIDLEQMQKLRSEQLQVMEKKKSELAIMVSAPEFNPRSPKQVGILLQILGAQVKSTEEKDLKKAMFQHPLNTRILDGVISYRKAGKLVSTYLVEKKFWKGRCLYAINPHGTDTARLASTESQFRGWSNNKQWAGLQIHNIPRDRKDIEIKSMFFSDPGFYFGEADYSQAEARDVAYLSGDLELLKTVESGKDFHSLNVERFFGLLYEKIFDDSSGSILDKEIRDLCKRITHGWNYNMGWQVLIDTMGLEFIYLAQKLLKLNPLWGARKIAEYLIELPNKAYPTVKTDYYDSIKYSVKTTHQLVSALGWTRYCFGNPEKNKQDLNSYVAHPSQNLNAGTLNIAWMRIFEEVALKEPKDFKLCAQIHDSILFQYRIGRRDLVRRVKECMLFSVRVKDCKGIERDLRVPVDMKAEAGRWSEIKKYEVEYLSGGWNDNYSSSREISTITCK